MKYGYVALPLAALAFAACATDSPVSPGTSAALNYTTITPPTTEQGNCLDSGGWSKTNASGTPQSTGLVSGAWGSYNTSGATLTYNVAAGYTVQFCVKSGSQAGTTGYQVVGVATGDIVISQDISHVSYHVTGSPPQDPRRALTVTKTAAGTFGTETAWDLSKTGSPATLSGTAGESVGPFTWAITATKTVTPKPFQVSGTITIQNDNMVPVGFTVADTLSDGTVAAVSCPAFTVPAKSGLTSGQVVCTYTATAGEKAARNKATVTAPGFPVADPADVEITWTPVNTGDATVTMTDTRLSISEETSETKSWTVPESFVCSTTLADYLANNGWYSRTETNTATLTGGSTNLTKSADVSYTCVGRWAGETATGAGARWSSHVKGVSNWFMFTTSSALSAPGGATLVAGQHHNAGTVSSNGSGSITVTLNLGFRFAAVSNNVKILPMASCTPSSYVQPGQYSSKTTVSNPLQTSVTVTGLASAPCYAIHVDVQRLLP
jgi:hypothetical protein